MPGAGSAPREARSRMAALLIPVFVCLLGAAAPPAVAASTSATTIDFSQHGEGPFDGAYFADAAFTEGSWVGYIQGDQALVGPTSGTAKKKFSSISASVAPAIQGTAIYTLAAFESNGGEIASRSVTITQDTGDPETGPWGYVTIDLGPLAKRASSFRISNEFVRSSHSHITQIEFGVSAITLSR
jgi:hypothetical protein